MSLSSVTSTALSGLSAAATQLDLVANNIANLQTPGFRAAHVELASASPQPMPGGVTVAGVSVDPVQGSITVSNQPALLALEGEGLFILQSPAGERLYTRDGHFQLAASGQLVDQHGYDVLGFAADASGAVDASGLAPLALNLGSRAPGIGGQGATLRSYTIQRDGRIVGHYTNGVHRTLARLRLARFPNPSGLVQRGGNLLRPSPASGLPHESNPAENGAAAIAAGAGELSNVELGHELVELTLAANMFRANLHALETADSLLDEMFFPWRVR